MIVHDNSHFSLEFLKSFVSFYMNESKINLGKASVFTTGNKADKHKRPITGHKIFGEILGFWTEIIQKAKPLIPCSPKFQVRGFY